MVIRYQHLHNPSEANVLVTRVVPPFALPPALSPLLVWPLLLRSFVLFLDLLPFSSLPLPLGVLAFRLLLFPVEFLEVPNLFVAQIREPASL